MDQVNVELVIDRDFRHKESILPSILHFLASDVKKSWIEEQENGSANGLQKNLRPI